MSTVDIRLRYGLKDESYYGVFTIGDSKTEFSKFTFARMFSHLAHYIRDFEDAEVVLSRYEKEDSDYKLEDDFIKLLRVDPAKAIQSMHHPDRVVIVRDKNRDVPVSSSARLRSGHDTLADAFGEKVYLRFHEGKLECPFCGRWTDLAKKLNDAGQSILNCDRCGVVYTAVFEITDKWLIMDISTLIDPRWALVGKNRLFIPRRWNEAGPWITRGDLETKFEDFKKERDQCRDPKE